MAGPSTDIAGNPADGLKQTAAYFFQPALELHARMADRFLGHHDRSRESGAFGHGHGRHHDQR